MSQPGGISGNPAGATESEWERGSTLCLVLGVATQACESEWKTTSAG